MKYKKPKYSSYKKFNQSNRKPTNKRALIIGISIAVAVLLIAIAVVAVIILGNINSGNSSGNNGDGGNSIIDNIFGKDDKPVEDKITSVQIVGYPNKRTYYCGDWFDKTGLRVYAFYESGAYKSVIEDCTITGFDSSSPAESQTITVTYGEFTDTFTVEIRKKLEPIEVVVESIAIGNLPKTEYKIGEWLETTGGTFVVTYTDGTTKTVDMEPGHISGFQSAMDAGVGTRTLKVVYVENGIRVNTTFEITITK